MKRTLKDDEVASLIKEKKQLPVDWRKRLHMRTARCGAHREAELEVQGDGIHRFKIILRENPNLPNDFSVILVYYDNKTTVKWRLRRYNSPSSFPHTNWMEYREGVPGNRFSQEAHIHTCTARYQEEGGHKEDHYAEITDRFFSIDEAIACFVEDCGFVFAPNAESSQTRLF